MAVVIIGNGAHASDIRDSLHAMDVWPHEYAHHKLAPSNVNLNAVYIGVNDPRLRAIVAKKLGVLDELWIHPDARLYHDVIVGYGSHVNYSVHAVRTCIANHTTISPGVTICGDVGIGSEVLVGAGAVICDRVMIGDGATIGAGAIVLPETVVPAGETWVGNPARRLR